MGYVKMNFESQYLRGNTEVNVIFPNRKWDRDAEQFYDEKRRFKVLWLLHGTTGDCSDWLRYSMIEVYADENDLLVVMPSTQNASYSNWPGFGGGYDVYDYFFKELMPMIYNWFPASDKREDNFIAGLSMGGLGAIKFALTDPDKFAAAGVLSAAPHHYEHELTMPKYQQNGRYKNQFANAGGYQAFLDGDDNVWRMAVEAAGRTDLPRLYFSEGEEDEFYEVFVHWREKAEEIGFPCVFDTLPGYTHESRVWNRTVQRAMKFFGFRVREDTDAY